jgi:hypothetical protein
MKKGGGSEGPVEVYHFESPGGNRGGVIAPVDETDQNLLGRIASFSRLMREKQAGKIISVESKTFSIGTKTDEIFNFVLYGDRCRV